jgi:hypothetical protein
LNGNLGIGTTSISATDAISIVGSNSSRRSIVIQNTNSAGNASFYFQNERGSFASYGGLLHGGSTYPSTFFGVSSSDKTILLSDGASSTGLCIGTLLNTDIFFGTNNTSRARIFGSTGNLLLQNGGTFTDAGYRLDVNGTARVSGASSFGENLTLSKSFNGELKVNVVNATSGTASSVALQLTPNSAAGSAQIFKYSSTTTPYKTIAASDFGHYNATAGDISFLNDFATGNIKFAAGGSSTAHMTLASNGNLLVGTTTDAGEKFQVNGTARVSGAMLISSGTTSQGVFIGPGGSIRYTSESGVNTNAVYCSGNTTTQDVIISYVGGNATSNINLYIQTSGYIGTKGGLRLGAASGTDVLTALTNTWLNVAAGTTARSQINLASSTAPTSPNNGDIWFDGTDLKMRIGGVTKTFTLV